MNLRVFSLCMTAIAVLSACSSTGSGTYISLPGGNYRAPTHHGQAVLVNVIPAAPYAGPSLVYENSDASLTFSRQHLWAEPLENAAAKLIANTLNDAQSERVYVVSPQFKPSTTLNVYLEAFYGSNGGNTHVRAYSVWQTPSGSRMGHNCSVDTPQRGDGYAAMVKALAQGLQQCALQF